jgi:ABC-type phosphate transport system permease subunit
VFDSGRALAVHIYDLSMNVAGGEGGAAATAVVLVGLLTLINLCARRLGQALHRMQRA